MAKAAVLCERLLQLCKETFPNVDTSMQEGWNSELEVNRMFNLIKESTIEQCEIVLETFVDCEYADECSGVEMSEDSEEAEVNAVSNRTMESQSSSKESRRWLGLITEKCRYVSRKITKYVTRREIENREELEKTAIEFVNSVIHECQNVDPGDIYNFDESGFK